MDGLVVDKGIYYFGARIPAKFGDRALPYLRKAIEQSKDGNVGRIVRCLAYLHTQQSTDLLLDLYDSGEDKMRSASEYALIHEPFRKEAKHAYFDMLKRQSRVHAASKACLEFGWKDALPILEEVIAQIFSNGNQSSSNAGRQPDITGNTRCRRCDKKGKNDDD